MLWAAKVVFFFNTDKFYAAFLSPQTPHGNFWKPKGGFAGFGTPRSGTALAAKRAAPAYLTNGFSPFTASAGVMRLPPLSRSMST